MLLNEILIYTAALMITTSAFIAWLYYGRNRILLERNRLLSETIALNTTMNSLEEVLRNEDDTRKALECVVSTINTLLGTDGILILQKENEAFVSIAEAYSNPQLRGFLLANTSDTTLETTTPNQEMIVVYHDMGEDTWLNTIILQKTRNEIQMLTAVHIMSNAQLQIDDLNQYQNKLLYYLNQMTLLATELAKQRAIDQIIAKQKEDEKRATELAETLKSELEHKAAQKIENEKRAAELMEQLERELEYKKLQNDFISMASHEFRTPLAVIGSSIYLVQKQMKGLFEHWKKMVAYVENSEGTGDGLITSEIVQRHTNGYDKVSQLINTINSYVNHLSLMIGSTLKMAIMDERGIQNTMQPLAIGALVQEAVGKLQHLRNDIKINYTDQSDGKWVWFDRGNLDHVLTNLVSNAIKYSRPDTEINIIVAAKSKKIVVLKVCDQGIGIPKEQQEQLFTKFFRGSNTAGITGVGVGLYVTKKLLLLNNAEISVESEPGIGTTFFVYFTAAPDPATIEDRGNENAEQITN